MNKGLTKKTLALVSFPATMLGGLAVMFNAIAMGWSLPVVSLAIGGVTLGLGLLLERLMPLDAAPREPGELKTDLWSMGVVLGLVEPALGIAAPIAVATAVGFFGVEGIAVFPTQWPLWAQFVLVVLIAELGAYWAHRWSHEIEVLWRFHAVHHSPHRLDMLNNFRIHPINHILTHTLSILPLIILGAAVEVLMLHAVFHATGVVFQHVDARLEHGWLNGIFSTNAVHRWHHSSQAPEGDTNFGATLIIWDRLFRTYKPATGQGPVALGLYNEEGYPVHDFWQQLVAPLCWPGCTGARA